MIQSKKLARYVHPKILSRLAAGTKEYLSVIIYSNDTCESLQKCILDAGGEVKYSIPLINAVAAKIPQRGSMKSLLII